MKIKNLLLLTLLSSSLILASCNNSSTEPSSEDDSHQSEPEENPHEEETPIDEDEEEESETATLTSIKVVTPPTKVNYYIGESLDLTGIKVSAYYSDNSSKSLSQSQYSVTGFNSSSKQIQQKITVTYQSLKDYFYVNIIEQEEDEDEDERILLDCGYYQAPLPKNETAYQLKTTLSADNTSWSNNSLKVDLPDDFRFIYGNSYDDGEPGHVAQPKFYSNDAGGLKFDQRSKGFQSMLFNHEGAKLEFRIGISQVNNASGSPEKGKDVFDIYFFNKLGGYLGKYAQKAESFDSKTTEIKFYITEDYTSEIAYFELRQISSLYKGNQCYNFGMGYINFKSWERI